MVRVAVNGALGRMGSRILNLAYAAGDFKIAAAFERRSSGLLGKKLGTLPGFPAPLKVRLSALSPARLAACDVLIDFSSPEGTRRCLAAALKFKTAVVIGTTGIEAAGEEAIRETSKKTAVLFSPNMSLGANFLFELSRLAAARLKSGYDAEVIEKHHRLKKDAPSGTAKKIAGIIAGERGWALEKAARYGRQGLAGERTGEEIGIHAVRAGDIVGEHTVIFGGPGETLELTHRAQSRDAFARGALAAALFLSKKKKGLYSMSDVLTGKA